MKLENYNPEGINKKGTVAVSTSLYGLFLGLRKENKELSKLLLEFHNIVASVAVSKGYVSHEELEGMKCKMITLATFNEKEIIEEGKKAIESINNRFGL